MWIGDTWVNPNEAWKYSPSQIMGAQSSISSKQLATKYKKKTKSKTRKMNMWKAKSSRLYRFLKNPRNGTKKERRLASYILSTRKSRR